MASFTTQPQGFFINTNSPIDERYVVADSESRKTQFAGDVYYEGLIMYQKDTEEALTKLQEYINRYTDSERMVEVNSTVERLLRKLERKSFENAKQFFTIRDYKAAIKAIDNFIGDFPGTPFREVAMFIQFRAASILAINSVFLKKEERLESAVSYFDDFVRAYPESEFLDESISIMNDIEEEITTFATN